MKAVVTVNEIQAIIRKIEGESLRVIGTKDESGIIVSLKEDSQHALLELLCQAINEQLKLKLRSSSGLNVIELNGVGL